MSRTSRSVRRVACVLAALIPPLSVPLFPGVAASQMALTGVGQFYHFTLSTFAYPFNGSCAPIIGGGVASVAYLSTGEVLVNNINLGSIYKLADHSDNQVGPGLVAHHFTLSGEEAPFELCQIQIQGTWHYYATNVNGLTELDSNSWDYLGLVSPAFNGLACVPFPPGIGGPHSGHIFFTAVPSDSSHGAVMEFDPGSNTTSIFFNDFGSEAMAITADGNYLLLDAPTDTATYKPRIVGVPLSVGPQPWSWEPPAYPDTANAYGFYTGIASGVGNLDGYVLVMTDGGQLFEFGTPNGPYANFFAMIAAGGVRAEALCPDADVPCSGGAFPSVIVSQCDRLLRLDPPGGGWIGTPTSSVTPVQQPTAVPDGETPAPPRILVLPNPAFARAHVRFTMARGGPVQFEVLDVQGRRVVSFAEGTMEPGTHELDWDGSTPQGPAPSGVYFARVAGGGNTLTARFTLTH